jgi:hypothetical protein
MEDCNLPIGLQILNQAKLVEEPSVELVEGTINQWIVQD